MLCKDSVSNYWVVFFIHVMKVRDLTRAERLKGYPLSRLGGQIL